jgi:hypothetical protein
MPPALAHTIAEAVGTAFSTSKASAQLTSFGLERMPGAPADLAGLMIAETAFWRRVALKANITPR